MGKERSNKREQGVAGKSKLMEKTEKNLFFILKIENIYFSLLIIL